MYRGYEKREGSQAQNVKNSGPFLAVVVNVLDVKYQGALEVRLIKSQLPSNAEEATNEETETVVVKYLNPFFGITNYDGVSKNHKYENSQQTYGMWFVPPDVGNKVLVMFVEGNINQGYWIGCVQTEQTNFMLPDGRPCTTFTDITDQILDAEGNEVSEFDELRGKKLPVGEYNKKLLSNLKNNDPSKFNKPINRLFKDTLTQQGLLEDETRGLTTSSARREIPSKVFGISTPGPLDKRGAQKNTFTGYYSRLGGTSIVMDDGDDKFVRKGSPTLDPSEYFDIAKDDSYVADEDNVTRPHNELFRIRTRTGHQILLHNSEDLIYVGNSKGTTWIEMTANGKIDVYAEDSVSIHTKQDFNFNADRDVNIEAGRNINVKAGSNIQLESSEWLLKANSSGYITVGAQLHENIGSDYFFTLGGDSHTVKASGKTDHASPATRSGSPSASPAASVGSLYTFDSPNATSIMKRVPQHEPWNHHENFDPANVNSVRTDRNNPEEIGTVDLKPIPDTFND